MGLFMDEYIYGGIMVVNIAKSCLVQVLRRYMFS